MMHTGSSPISELESIISEITSNWTRFQLITAEKIVDEEYNLNNGRKSGVSVEKYT